MIVHDAAEAFVALIDAATAWVQALAGASALVLCLVAFVAFGSGPFIGSTVKTAQKRVAGPSWRRGRVRARILARRRIRAPRARTAPRPHWVHTQPLDYEEAA